MTLIADLVLVIQLVDRRRCRRPRDDATVQRRNSSTRSTVFRRTPDTSRLPVKQASLCRTGFPPGWIRMIVECTAAALVDPSVLLAKSGLQSGVPLTAVSGVWVLIAPPMNLVLIHCLSYWNQRINKSINH